LQLIEEVDVQHSGFLRLVAVLKSCLGADC